MHPGLSMAVAALLGLLAWPAVEYAIHGVLAHRLRTFVSPLHWGHHRTPANVFTSPVAWLPLAAFVLLGASAVAGPAPGGAFTAGLLAGFLRYEYVHWRIHFRTPRNARQARLRAHHLAHHFVDPKAYHGVTTRLLDRLLGTLPDAWPEHYARAAERPPIPGPSNLRAHLSPRATARLVRQHFSDAVDR